jgi:hypothetical protein
MSPDYLEREREREREGGRWDGVAFQNVWLAGSSADRLIGWRGWDIRIMCGYKKKI